MERIGRPRELWQLAQFAHHPQNGFALFGRLADELKATIFKCCFSKWRKHGAPRKRRTGGRVRQILRLPSSLIQRIGHNMFAYFRTLEDMLEACSVRGLAVRRLGLQG